MDIGILRGYILDYVTWQKNDKGECNIPFSLAMKKYAFYRKSLYDSQNYSAEDYGYSIDNPIMGLSGPHIDRFLDSLRKEDGKEWKIEYSGQENVSLRGFDDILIYEYSVKLDDEEYCKLYCCPFGMGPDYVPKGFRLSKDGYIRVKNLKQVESGKGYDDYIYMKEFMIERNKGDTLDYYLKTIETDLAKEKIQLELLTCSRCGIDLLPNEQYCVYCGNRNIFYDPEYSFDRLDTIAQKYIEDVFGITQTCEKCGAKTRKSFYAEKKKENCPVVTIRKSFPVGEYEDRCFCSSCGYLRQENAISMNSECLFDIENYIHDHWHDVPNPDRFSECYSLSVSKNGEMIVNDVLLVKKLDKDQVEKISKIINDYKPVMREIQTFCFGEKFSGHATLNLKFDVNSFTFSGLHERDLCRVYPQHQEKAFCENCMIELLSEIIDEFNTFQTGVEIHLRIDSTGNKEEKYVALTFSHEIEKTLEGELERKESEERKRIEQRKDFDLAIQMERERRYGQGSVEQAKVAKAERKRLFSWLKR